MEKDMTREESLTVDVEKSSFSQELVECVPALSADPNAEARLVRRIDIRLVPVSLFIYLLCFIDRSNIGNARILNSDAGDSLAQTTHISNRQYLVALLIFIIAYSLFEVPSNYLLHRFRPSKWIAFLMLGWGIMTMILGTVKTFAELVIIRLLLGAFEAGLFPGIVYCLTYWYKQDERAGRLALITGGATLAGAFGGAIAFGVGHMDRTRALQGWRWLFIFEGIPSILCAIPVYFFYPDYPEVARWLSAEERTLAAARIKGVAALGHEQLTWADARATLRDWRLYLHDAVCIAFSVAFSSVSLFTPTIVSGLGFAGLKAQLFTVPPYAIGFVVTVFIAWQADKRAMRSWAAFACLTIAGVCFLIQGLLPANAFKARYGLLCVSVPFSFAIQPPLLSWLSANLRSTGAMALALPLNIAIGQIGQVVGIYIYKSSEAPGYPTGHFTNAGFLLIGAIMVLILRGIYIRRNRSLSVGEKEWQL
ncbi:MFS general substrate transporter [Phanerochaete sordida]|uniref:MFS general substrate transporter n=1 Tax=Phanerochaete sordida TaxID=48140 RepID=A0A9P3GKI3_9APHY|nr:MFS general substrate transporter [Phanerochaete sordida]